MLTNENISKCRIKICADLDGITRIISVMGSTTIGGTTTVSEYAPTWRNTTKMSGDETSTPSANNSMEAARTTIASTLVVKSTDAGKHSTMDGGGGTSTGKLLTAEMGRTTVGPNLRTSEMGTQSTETRLLSTEILTSTDSQRYITIHIRTPITQQNFIPTQSQTSFSFASSFLPSWHHSLQPEISRVGSANAETSPTPQIGKILV